MKTRNTFPRINTCSLKHRVEKPYLPDQPLMDDRIEIKESTIPDAGRGVFTKQKIRKGELLGYYNGVFMTSIPDNCDCDYIFTISDNPPAYIDGCRKNTWTSFMNHSYKPNVEAIERVTKDGSYVEFRALKRIEPDVELFFNYGRNYWRK